jgi:predicted enzyme related to lactoylglutathione lyase
VCSRNKRQRPYDASRTIFVSGDEVSRPALDDSEAAIAAAVDAGGELAHPPMEIPGHGTFAIYILGGVDHGLWQL